MVRSIILSTAVVLGFGILIAPNTHASGGRIAPPPRVAVAPRGVGAPKVTFRGWTTGCLMIVDNYHALTSRPEDSGIRVSEINYSPCKGTQITGSSAFD